VFGSKPNTGVCYRGDNIHAANDGTAKSGFTKVPERDGAKLEIILDFDRQTLEFMVESKSQGGSIDMKVAGIANQPLCAAAGFYTSGTRVKLSVTNASTPTPTVIPAVATPVVTPTPTPVVIPAAAAVASTPILKAPAGFPKERLVTRLAILRSVVPPLNILVMGPAGGGKSTFINSCYTSCSPPERTDPITVCSLHLTLSLFDHVVENFT
jgi:hypothetical protein